MQTSTLETISRLPVDPELATAREMLHGPEGLEIEPEVLEIFAGGLAYDGGQYLVPVRVFADEPSARDLSGRQSPGHILVGSPRFVVSVDGKAHEVTAVYLENPKTQEQNFYHTVHPSNRTGRRVCLVWSGPTEDDNGSCRFGLWLNSLNDQLVERPSGPEQLEQTTLGGKVIIGKIMDPRPTVNPNLDRLEIRRSQIAPSAGKVVPIGVAGASSETRPGLPVSVDNLAKKLA